jgi:hypothetical protein
MLIKTNIILRQIKTKEAIKGEDDKPLTIGIFLCNLLSMSVAEDAHKSYVLAKQFGTQDEVSIKSEDITYIKKAISLSRVAPLTAGQAIEILEGEVPKEEENIINNKKSKK